MLWPKKILVLAKKIFDYSCCGLKISTGQQIIGLFMLWPKKISTGQQNIWLFMLWPKTIFTHPFQLCATCNPRMEGRSKYFTNTSHKLCSKRENSGDIYSCKYHKNGQHVTNVTNMGLFLWMRKSRRLWERGSAEGWEEVLRDFLYHIFIDRLFFVLKYRLKQIHETNPWNKSKQILFQLCERGSGTRESILVAFIPFIPISSFFVWKFTSPVLKKDKFGWVNPSFFEGGERINRGRRVTRILVARFLKTNPGNKLKKSPKQILETNRNKSSSNSVREDERRIRRNDLAARFLGCTWNKSCSAKGTNPDSTKKKYIWWKNMLSALHLAARIPSCTRNKSSPIKRTNPLIF